MHNFIKKIKLHDRQGSKVSYSVYPCLVKYLRVRLEPAPQMYEQAGKACQAQTRLLKWHFN